MEKLKACPFCGGRAEIRDARSFDDEFCVGIQCMQEGCFACVTFAVRSGDDTVTAEDVRRMKQFATRQWNRRAK